MSFELLYGTAADAPRETVECPGWVSGATWQTPGWFTPQEAAAIIRAACSLGPTGKLVELGTWRGRSAAILADALGPGWEIHTVDEYPAAYVGQDKDHDPAAARRAAAELLDQRTNVARWLGPSASPAKIEADNPTAYVLAQRGPRNSTVRVLFVDAEHSEDAVMADLNAWGRFVARHGFVFLHDTNDPRVGEGVRAGALKYFEARTGEWRRRVELEAGSLWCFQRVA